MQKAIETSNGPLACRPCSRHAHVCTYLPVQYTRVHHRNIASDSAGKRGLVPCALISKIYDALGLNLNHLDGVYTILSLQCGQAAAGLSLSLSRSLVLSLNSFQKCIKNGYRLRLYKLG